MTMRQQVAEQTANLVVGGLSLLGISAGVLVPGAILAACGLDRRRAAREASGQAAVDAVVAVLRDHGDENTTRALDLLSRYRDRISIDPAMLQEAHTRDDFPATLYTITFGTGSEIEPAVESLLREVIRNAYEALRRSPHFHRVWVQESLGSLKRAAAAQGLTLTRLEAFARDEADRAADRHETLRDDITLSATRADANHADLLAALRDLQHSSRDTLESLATRFHIQDPFDLPDA